MLLADRLRRHIDREGPFPALWFDLELDEYVKPPAAVTRCWLWRGKKDEKGYGRFRVGDGEMAAHRVVWKAVGRALGRGDHLDHRCLRTSCVNPRHLDRVTPEENRRRAEIVRKGSARG